MISGCGWFERYFTRPFTEVVGTTWIKARNQFAFADAAKMTVDATRRAGGTGLRANEVNGLVTSHTTRAFRSPPSGARVAGQALVHATDLVRSRTGAAVLVVVSEAQPTVYHHDEDTIESVIYKALFGDSAGFAVEEFLLPDSADRYRGEFDTGGLHIITQAAAALELRHEDGEHAIDSLQENGNLGGNAVLDVLRRTHEAPPATGAEGVIIAFGPGFAVAGARGTWR